MILRLGNTGESQKFAQSFDSCWLCAWGGSVDRMSWLCVLFDTSQKDRSQVPPGNWKQFAMENGPFIDDLSANHVNCP